MPWGFAAAAVGSVAAGAIGADASKDAARTQAGAADRASQVQREMFDISNAQQQPFMQTGYAANDSLSRLMGLAPTAGRTQSIAPGANAGSGGAGGWGPNNGRLVGDQWLPKDAETVDKGGGWYEVHHGGQRVGTLRPGGANGRFVNDTNWQMPGPSTDPAGSSASGAAVDPETGYAADNTGLPTGYLTQTFGPQQFLAGMDPGYQWRMQQGAQGVMNTAAAGSGSLSGPALKALMEYNQGAASQEYGASFDRFQTQQGNIFQRLTSLAQTGQNAAAGVGAQGVATAGNIGSNIVGAGNAAAAGQVGAANAWGGALSDMGSMAYLYGRGRMDRPPPAGP